MWKELRRQRQRLSAYQNLPENKLSISDSEGKMGEKGRQRPTILFTNRKRRSDGHKALRAQLGS